MSSDGRPLGPWIPSTPMVLGNMSTLLNLVKRTMQVRDLHLLPTIRHVLRQKIGPEKYTELLTSNVRNGTNDQKRLILRVAQAYTRLKKISKKAPVPRDYFSSDSDVEVLNKCMTCNSRHIDTINMPCGCETSCLSCAGHLQEIRPLNNKCLKCNHNIRSLRPVDSGLEVQCSSCGFVWDGNAQHMCEAPERIVLVPKQFGPMPDQYATKTKTIITEKVSKVVELILEEYASPEVIDGIWARSSEKWNGGISYEFQLKDEWFVGLQEEFRKIGLQLVNSEEQFNSLEIKVDPNSHKNLWGRYGPDKDRLIQIPNYQRRGIFGNYDQEKVRDAVKDIAEFNWVKVGLTGNYTTTLSKMPDEDFKIIQRKLKRLKLQIPFVRSTYFDIAYNIIPKKGSQVAEDRYALARYV